MLFGFSTLHPPLQSSFVIAILHIKIHSSYICLKIDGHPAQSKSFPNLNYLPPPPLASVPCFYSCTQCWHQHKTLGQKTKSFNNSTNLEASLGRKWETSSPSLLLPAAESMEVIIFLAQEVKGSGKSSFVGKLLQPDIMDLNNENRAKL